MKVAVDIGFGYTKAIAENGKSVVFPSMVSKRMTANSKMGFAYKENYIVTYMNNIYAIGEAALNSPNSSANFSEDRFTDEFSKILLLTALHALDIEEQNIELAIGLPIMLYSNYSDKVRDYIEFAEETIIINNEVRRYKIDVCEVFPQGVGALFSINDKIPNGYISVIDVGFRTTDVLLVKYNKGDIIPLTEFSFSVDEGTSRILTTLTKHIQHKYGIARNETNILDVFETGVVLVKGREKDITEARDEIVREVTESIINKIVTKWNDFVNDVVRIYVAGGGAYMISPHLKVIGEMEIKIVDDPQFANAKGFLNMLESISVENNT
ncbi:hypothetical protein ACAG39_02090 [Caldicellulosiruptoraceae bacterium PP1]